MTGRLIPAYIEVECWVDELPFEISISAASNRTFDFMGKKFAVTSLETMPIVDGRRGWRVKFHAVEVKPQPSIRDNYR